MKIMDVLNFIALLDEDMKSRFSELMTKNFIIDSNFGKFDRRLSLPKDYILGVWKLLNTLKV